MQKVVKLNLEKLMRENGSFLKFGGSVEYSKCPENAYCYIVNDSNSIIANDREKCIVAAELEEKIVLKCSKTGYNLVLSKTEYDICCGEKVTDKEIFTNEELHILSNAMINLIKSTNDSRALFYDEEIIDSLKKASSKYVHLNDKICRMMREEEE